MSGIRIRTPSRSPCKIKETTVVAPRRFAPNLPPDSIRLSSNIILFSGTFSSDVYLDTVRAFFAPYKSGSSFGFFWDNPKRLHAPELQGPTRRAAERLSDEFYRCSGTWGR